MLVNKSDKKDIGLVAPPAKAYTLRAIFLASLAEGRSVIENPLLAADQRNLIDALERLGVTIREEENTLVIDGCGGAFSPVKRELDVGESGVAMNTLLALASLVPGDIVLTGAPGLVERPVGELVDALRQLGCDISYEGQEGFPPVKISSGQIRGGTTRLSGKKTSQYFSSLALSAPYAQDDVTIVCTDELSEKPYFDISADMMRRFGVALENDSYRTMRVAAGQRYRACTIRIEGDWSSASFYLLAAAVLGARVRVADLDPESCQGDRLFAGYLERMGCALSQEDGLFVIEGGPLQPITVDMGDTPDLVPPLAIAAAFARGTSVFTNVGRLRYKECNRLEAMKSELAKLGVVCQYDDELVIQGNPVAMRAAVEAAAARGEAVAIDSWNDHRIAMSFAVAGLALGNLDIGNPGCVSKSFPDFWERIAPFAD